MLVLCPRCDGAGMIRDFSLEDETSEPEIEERTCPRCDGESYINVRYKLLTYNKSYRESVLDLWGTYLNAKHVHVSPVRYRRDYISKA